jgi:hypothetical protein
MSGIRVSDSSAIGLFDRLGDRLESRASLIGECGPSLAAEAAAGLRHCGV